MGIFFDESDFSNCCAWIIQLFIHKKTKFYVHAVEI